MSQDSFDYPHLVQIALRGMVRDVLLQVEQHGLPGVHHFYVTYDTRHPDVVLSADLRSRYPERITIVLQHDYRELVVEEDRFSVILHFAGMPQRIRVPYDALVTFYDPSEEFALQFDPVLPRTSGPVGVPDQDEGSDESGTSETKPGSLRIPVRAVLEAADRMQAEKEATAPEDAADDIPAEPVAAESEASRSGEAPSDEAEAPQPAAEAAPSPSPEPTGASEPDGADRKPASDVEPGDDGSSNAEASSADSLSNVVSIDAFRRK